MPDTPKDRRLDKLALWGLQTFFGVGLLVAGWFLGGLYERVDKTDERVEEAVTLSEVNKKQVEQQSQSNAAQWRKIGDIQERLSRIEGKLDVN